MEGGLSENDYAWVSYEEWTKSNLRDQYTPPISSPSTNTPAESPRACRCEPKDLAVSKLQRRREQNRTSQQKFREKTRKDYEAVVHALEAEKEMSARLRDEVTALHTTIQCLAKGNQNCLETISRLFMAGCAGKVDLDGEGAGEGMGELDKEWGGVLPSMGQGGVEGL